jgi:hypothetical protein
MLRGILAKFRAGATAGAVAASAEALRATASQRDEQAWQPALSGLTSAPGPPMTFGNAAAWRKLRCTFRTRRPPQIPPRRR